MTIKQTENLKIIGAMTGNSLDGCDAVLAEFSPDGRIKDLASAYVHNPEDLKEMLRHLRHYINQCGGDMDKVAHTYQYPLGDRSLSFDDVNKAYADLVISCVEEVIKQAGLTRNDIDAVSIHGQTCAHVPPSIVGQAYTGAGYTVQIGDGQAMADKLGITVIYDFRSDDIMNGGEGAPLTPMHNEHLAEHTKKQGKFPIAFCNGGNTGNIGLITTDQKTGRQVTMGWDTGPFNNYVDKLVQAESGQPFDKDAAIASSGKVNLELLAALFNKAVVTKNGDNFLLVVPPKSSDPQWYLMIDELKDKKISLADRVRTAAYFSAYIYVYAIGLTPANLQIPKYFAVFGGGWNNQVIFNHFKGLLLGDLKNNPILPEHEKFFALLAEKIGKDVHVDWSDAYGFNARTMEGRLWADMGRCRLLGIPFTKPSITNVKQDTVCGLVRFPTKSPAKATPTVQKLIKQPGFFDWTVDHPDIFDGRWSRASAGWKKKLA